MVIDSTIGFMEGVSGEIYSRQINKATGMAEVMKHYKVAIGKIRSHLETLGMILKCSNMRESESQWEMERRMQNRRQIILRRM